MSLLHADNFNSYGTNTNFFFNGVYADKLGDSAGSLVADPDGVSSGTVLKTDTASGDRGLRWVLPAAAATCGVARRLWMSTLPSDTTAPVWASAMIMQWRTGANAVIATLWVTTTGALVVSSGGGITGAVLAQTAVPVITANGWYHIEGKLFISATVGTVEVRVEGVTVLTGTGLNTGVSNVAQIAFGNTSSGSGIGGMPCYCKDLVVWDGNGSENIDFLGSVLVYELFTTSDSSFNWASTGANGYSVLENNPPQDGVAYISAVNPPPAASVFGLTDLPADVSSVKGLITRVRAAKSDGGDGQLKVSLRSGVSDDAGADRPITTSQTYWSDVSELDPATGSAWLPGAVNAAKLVLDRTL